MRLDTSGVWYMRKPYRFWRAAAFVVCLLRGHTWDSDPDAWIELPDAHGQMGLAHGDCWRCGA